MSAIHLDNLSFSYSTAVTVVDAASCSLGRGWTGIVGINGAGKTTLLRLIDASLEPVVGTVILDPQDALVVRCPQTADELDPTIEQLAVAWDGEAQAWRGRLRLEATQLDRWPTLSPGERKRWQIGAALYQDPDILLLDEPTNHLDTAARDLLVAALERFPGVGIVVSHDRAVLNRVCSRTLLIDHGRVRLWQGGYDVAKDAWERQSRADIADYQRLRAEQAKTARHLANKRHETRAKTSQHKRRLRSAGLKDNDARSMERKGRFEGGQRQASHEMSLLREQVDRLSAAAAAFDIKRQLGGEIFFDFEPARKKRLLGFQGDLVVAGTTLIKAVDVQVERSDRILLAGPNGSGKSTLLRSLFETATLDTGRVLYLPQELTGRDALDVIARVRALDSTTRGRVLGVVALLGSDPQRILATEQPSPGEARKLLIASGLGQGSWVLLLDEPTNHLDLPSIERLENALVAYPGAMVVVTHDQEFARKTTDRKWEVAGGKLIVG